MADIINNAGEGTVLLPSVSAPSDTTNKLYNESGVLTFDGISLEGGGGGLSNIVEDLTPQLGGNLDLNAFDIVGKPATSGTASGGGIDITAANAGQDAGSQGSGGSVVITGGLGGPYSDGYSYGGSIDLLAGDGSYYGGDIDIRAGDALPVPVANYDGYSYGGSIVIVGGKGYGYDSGSPGYGGRVRIFGGPGTEFAYGGAVQIYGGSAAAFADSAPGGVTIRGGNASISGTQAVDAAGGAVNIFGGAGNATYGAGLLTLAGGRVYDGNVLGSVAHGSVLLRGGQDTSGTENSNELDPDGGAVTISGGDGNSGVNVSGGAGNGGTGGTGGTVTISGGNGRQTAGSFVPMYGGAGGDLTLYAGDGVGEQVPGNVSISGGTSNSTSGSTVTIVAGAGGTYAGAGGAASLTAGSATLIGAGGALTFASGAGAGDGTAGVAEVTMFRSRTATSFSGGERFHLDDPTTPYYVWFTLDGGGADPAPGGRTSIGPVAVLTGNSAATIAGKIQIAIDAEGDFSAVHVALEDRLTVTNANTGTAADAVNIDAPIGISIEVQGSGAVSSDGGDVSVTSGAAGTTGAGGEIDLTAGAGGGAGAGGALDLNAGGGGATGSGGAVTINAGDSGASSGGGGSVTIRAGVGETGGGSLNIVGGYAGEYTAVDGGSATLRAGAAGYGGTGQGGPLLLHGGAGGYTESGSDSAGGFVSIRGGEAYGDADGGAIILRGGVAATAGTNGAGGDIRLSAARGKGTGIDGVISMQISDSEFARIRGTEDNITTDATDTLFISEPVVSGTATGFEAYIVGHEAATGDSVYSHITGLIKNVAGTTAIVGTNTTVRKEDAGASTWVLEVVANDTDDTLEVRMTGEAIHTIRWKVRITTTPI